MSYLKIRDEKTGKVLHDSRSWETKYMTNAVATTLNANTVATVLLSGDLSKLTPDQKISYYDKLCSSLGLNPLTKPFAYMKFQSKEVLYATRDCTDQLRKIHKVSIKITGRESIDGVYVVTAQASLPDGRCDESTGAVTTKGLTGEVLANAFLKCETKAKRRVTLSICGLGLLDETEVETIKDAKTVSTGNGHVAMPVKAVNTPQEIVKVISKPTASDARSLNTLGERKTPVLDDPGSFVVGFGKKYKGQRIDSIDATALGGFIVWCEEQAGTKGLPLSYEAQALKENYEAYLDQQADRDFAEASHMPPNEDLTEDEITV